MGNTPPRIAVWFCLIKGKRRNCRVIDLTSKSEAVALTPEAEEKSRADRKPFDALLMFRIGNPG